MLITLMGLAKMFGSSVSGGRSSKIKNFFGSRGVRSFTKQKKEDKEILKIFEAFLKEI